MSLFFLLNPKFYSVGGVGQTLSGAIWKRRKRRLPKETQELANNFKSASRVADDLMASAEARRQAEIRKLQLAKEILLLEEEEAMLLFLMLDDESQP